MNPNLPSTMWTAIAAAGAFALWFALSLGTLAGLSELALTVGQR